MVAGVGDVDVAAVVRRDAVGHAHGVGRRPGERGVAVREQRRRLRPARRAAGQREAPVEERPGAVGLERLDPEQVVGDRARGEAERREGAGGRVVEAPVQLHRHVEAQRGTGIAGAPELGREQPLAPAVGVAVGLDPARDLVERRGGVGPEPERPGPHVDEAVVDREPVGDVAEHAAGEVLAGPAARLTAVARVVEAVEHHDERIRGRQVDAVGRGRAPGRGGPVRQQTLRQAKGGGRQARRVTVLGAAAGVGVGA